VWVPGGYWSAGWVDWYWDSNFIGWCPLGYFDYWWMLGWPGGWNNDPHCWHQHCYHNFHGHVVFGHIDRRPFVFVDARTFGGVHPKFVRGAEFKGNPQAQGALRALTLPVKERDLGNITSVLKQARLEAGADLTPLFKQEPKLGAEYRTLLTATRTELNPRGTRVPQPEKTVFPNSVYHGPALPSPEHGTLPRTPIHPGRHHAETPDQTPSDRSFRTTEQSGDRTPAPRPKFDGRESSPPRYPAGQGSSPNHPTPSVAAPAPRTGSTPSTGSAPSPGASAPATPKPATTPNKRASLDAGGRDVIGARENTSASHSYGTASVTRNYYNAPNSRVRPNTGASAPGSSDSGGAYSSGRAPVSNYDAASRRSSEGAYSRAPVSHSEPPSYKPSGGSYSHSSPSPSSHNSVSTSSSHTSSSHASSSSSSSSSHHSSPHK
jgi:hypothetical protein